MANKYRPIVYDEQNKNDKEIYFSDILLFKYPTLNVNTTTYTIDDSVIYQCFQIDSSSNTVDIFLPPLTTNYVNILYFFKVVNYTNTIQLNPDTTNSDNIEGASVLNLVSNDSLILMGNSNSWRIYSRPSSGGGSYTFNNGLTETSGTVKLGGTLTQNTNIPLGSSNFSMFGGSNSILELHLTNGATFGSDVMLKLMTPQVSVGGPNAGDVLTVIDPNTGECDFTTVNGVTPLSIDLDLGSTLRKSGKIIAGISSSGVNQKITMYQAPGPYLNKGTNADEAVMDQIQFYVVPINTSQVNVYWNSNTFVKGNIKVWYF